MKSREGERSAAPVRVVLADARPTARDALRRMVEHRLGWLVVGEASDGLEAVRLSRQESADVLMADTAIRGLDLKGLDELIGDGDPLLVAMLDSPLQYLRGAGVGVLKGVPASRVGTIVTEELRRRRATVDAAS